MAFILGPEGTCSYAPASRGTAARVRCGRNLDDGQGYCTTHDLAAQNLWSRVVETLFRGGNSPERDGLVYDPAVAMVTENQSLQDEVLTFVVKESEKTDKAKQDTASTQTMMDRLQQADVINDTIQPAYAEASPPASSPPSHQVDVIEEAVEPAEAPPPAGGAPLARPKATPAEIRSRREAYFTEINDHVVDCGGTPGDPHEKHMRVTLRDVVYKISISGDAWGWFYVKNMRTKRQLNKGETVFGVARGTWNRPAGNTNYAPVSLIEFMDNRGR